MPIPASGRRAPVPGASRAPPTPIRRIGRAALAALVLSALAWSALATWSARAARADEAAHPPAGRFVTVDGARVHYLRRGPAAPGADAPTLVFLHGAGTSLLDALPALLPRLARRFDVVAVDRPGHGYSERGAAPADTGWVDPLAQARTVAAALRAIGVTRAVWIGHSWSGAVTLAALAALPASDASAGVLLAGVAYPWPGGHSTGPAEVAALPVIGPAFAHALVEPAGRAAMEPAIRAVFAPESVPAGYVEATGTALSLRPRTFRHDAIDRTRLSAWLEGASPRWSGIDRPLLAITGTEDRVVPPARHAERLAAARPGTRVVRLDGAGHGLIHTRAERIAREIGAFVGTLGTD